MTLHAPLYPFLEEVAKNVRYVVWPYPVLSYLTDVKRTRAITNGLIYKDHEMLRTTSNEIAATATPKQEVERQKVKRPNRSSKNHAWTSSRARSNVWRPLNIRLWSNRLQTPFKAIAGGVTAMKCERDPKKNWSIRVSGLYIFQRSGLIVIRKLDIASNLKVHGKL